MEKQAEFYICGVPWFEDRNIPSMEWYGLSTTHWEIKKIDKHTGTIYLEFEKETQNGS